MAILHLNTQHLLYILRFWQVDTNSSLSMILILIILISEIHFHVKCFFSSRPDLIPAPATLHLQHVPHCQLQCSGSQCTQQGEANIQTLVWARSVSHVWRDQAPEQAVSTCTGHWFSGAALSHFGRDGKSGDTCYFCPFDKFFGHFFLFFAPMSPDFAHCVTCFWLRKQPNKS